MDPIKSHRIDSIDLLRGLVMVIMALDHTRDYFLLGGMVNDPTNLETTTPLLFLTRFITNFCAPIFVFLAGISAFLYGSNKSKAGLFKFLFTRGLWLIFLEIVLNNFLWWFDYTYSFINLQVIWAIGGSMICLSLLIYLPRIVIFAIAVIIIASHNSLDSMVMEGNSLNAIVWYLLHQTSFVAFGNGRFLGIGYPILPWIGIMALGYVFGNIFRPDFNAEKRRKILLSVGLGFIALFLLLRGINMYGNLEPWSKQKDLLYTIFSFLKITKYPPSLDFVLITMGPALLFLSFVDRAKNRLVSFFLVFGKVPLYFYFLHILLIHSFALLLHALLGGNYQDLILTVENLESGKLISYGYSLGAVYLAWILIILILYPLSKYYMNYKATHRDKWWLSYL